MACTKGCGAPVEFEVDGGVCVEHYVDWCLAADETPPAEYETRYREVLKEVTDHMRVMDAMEEVRVLLKDGTLTSMFGGKIFVDLLSAAVASYDKECRSTNVEVKPDGMFS